VLLPIFRFVGVGRCVEDVVIVLGALLSCRRIKAE